jgi:hypothetical protein
MSRTGDEDGVPPRFNDENNMNNNQEGDKSGASGPPLIGGPHEMARKAHDQK